MTINRYFRPLSAEAFRHDEGYAELLPCRPLVPYVHCFWGTASALPASKPRGLVIPDLCMDLIFRINFTQNRIRMDFCSLDDRAYYTPGSASDDLCALFGIRFFAWSAICFCGESLSGTMGRALDAGCYLSHLQREIEPRLADCETLSQRTAIAQEVLLRHLHPERLSADLLNAFMAMIRSRGAARTADVAASVCLSQRQLERRFDLALGAPPKLVGSLIRYQMIYREIAQDCFHPLDAVAKYGYADQSHLIRDFKRFHSLTPREVFERLHS